MKERVRSRCDQGSRFSSVDILETDQRRLEKNKHESTRKDGSDGTSHSSVFPRGNKGDKKISKHNPVRVNVRSRHKQ